MTIDTLRQWATMFSDCAENVYDLPPDLLKTHKALTRLDGGPPDLADQARPDRHDP